MTNTNTINAQELKVGSIVRMNFNTYSKNLKEGWNVTDTYIYDGEEFITYSAECVVCNVTSKFFQVILPHTNSRSVRYSKNCFTDTTHSSVDRHNTKPVIVKI